MKMKNKVKKKHTVTRIIVIAASLLLALAIIGLLLPLIFLPIVDYGDSQLYSKTEMDEVIDMFSNGLGVVTIKYLGDERCEKELERYQAKDGKEYTDCMVFYYTFIRGTFRDFPFYDWADIVFLKEGNNDWFQRNGGKC